MSQNSLDAIYDQFTVALDNLSRAQARHNRFMAETARQTVDCLKQQIDEAEEELAVRYSA